MTEHATTMTQLPTMMEHAFIPTRQAIAAEHAQPGVEAEGRKGVTEQDHTEHPAVDHDKGRGRVRRPGQRAAAVLPAVPGGLADSELRAAAKASGGPNSNSRPRRIRDEWHEV